MKWILLLVSHTLSVLAGFAAGIYALPILIQPDSPDVSVISNSTEGVLYQGSLIATELTVISCTGEKGRSG